MSAGRERDRVMIGITRRYRVVAVVSVVSKDGDTNATLMQDVRSNVLDLKDGPGGAVVVEKVEDVEFIPEGRS